VFTASLDRSQPKNLLYKDLAASLAALLEDETDALANLSNASALLAQALDRINWCGFYLMRQGELVLGPFQGKPACVRIAVGKGVCGTAAARRESIVVPDVHAFPGHIACDAASRSEIVVPILEGRKLQGVLDVDAPEPGRFDDADRQGLESFVAMLAPRVDWRRL
jgi:L-methionine (R)-S-oxide reductase